MFSVPTSPPWGRIALLLIAARPTICATTPSSFDVFKYLDLLIGTSNGGNVFPGATLPYGMAKAVADVDGENTAGFSTDGSNVTGFSGMHDSGTGGKPSLGIFPIFPELCDDDDINNCDFIKVDRATHYVNESIVATPGYFALDLVNGISARMTVTSHTSLYEFSFPGKGSSALSPLILLDLTDLSDSRQNASVSVDPDTGRMTGNGTFFPSFGEGTYTAYFCADFRGSNIKSTGIHVNNRAGEEPKTIFVNRGISLFYIQAGSFIQFDPPSNGMIQARVANSFISSEQACRNAEAEIPDWDFDGTRSAAEDIWREKLSVIEVESGGVSDELQTNFWSAVYRTMVSPQDYTGENPLWKSAEPYFDSFYWYDCPCRPFLRRQARKVDTGF